MSLDTQDIGRAEVGRPLGGYAQWHGHPSTSRQRRLQSCNDNGPLDYRGKERTMSAYLIADVDITDPALFEEFKREVPATEARYGGRYLGRGGRTKVLEGN